jgi:hypothetical protein
VVVARVEWARHLSRSGERERNDMNYLDTGDDGPGGNSSWWSSLSNGQKVAVVAGAAVVLSATAYAIGQGGVVIAVAGVKIALGKAAVAAAVA